MARVRAFPWHTMPDTQGWEYGTCLHTLHELCQYWQDTFQWYHAETKINRFQHFTTPVEGIPLHFIHERSSAPNPLPLLISHGWPGSVVEFLDIIEPLAHPQRFGGDPQDGFDVIVPSLPGFAYSGAPPSPCGPRAIARLFNTLMLRLGYECYLAQGGDWGGAIASWLGFEASPCQGIHINIMTMRHPQGPQTPEEHAWAKHFEQDQILQNGYRTIQATKPQTLGYAMHDSPVGAAAWILEKFHGWSDLPTTPDSLWQVHSQDTLLTNIMVYLTTECFNTASWIYYGRRLEGGRILSPEGRRVEVPTACALFPQEMLRWPPRSYVERLYNVTQWHSMPRGGHFAALEQPALLIEDIRAFARSLRS